MALATCNSFWIGPEVARGTRSSLKSSSFSFGAPTARSRFPEHRGAHCDITFGHFKWCFAFVDQISLSKQCAMPGLRIADDSRSNAQFGFLHCKYLKRKVGNIFLDCLAHPMQSRFVFLDCIAHQMQHHFPAHRLHRRPKYHGVFVFPIANAAKNS